MLNRAEAKELIKHDTLQPMLQIMCHKLMESSLAMSSFPVKLLDILQATELL